MKTKATLGRAVLALCVLLMCLVAPAALAGGLSVTPLRLDVPAGQAAVALTLHNDDAKPMDVQVRVFAWQQDGDQDRYDATDEIMLNPPRATIPANGSQVVRLYRRGPALANEKPYRVFVDQLIDPADATPNAIQLPLRFILPLFAQGTQPCEPQLDFALQGTTAAPLLSVHAAGSCHARLTALAVNAAGAPDAGAEPQLVYVLPQARRTLHLSAKARASVAKASTWKVTAESDAGTQHATVQLASP